MKVSPRFRSAGRVLDGEIVEAELALDDAELAVGRLEQADPHDMALAPRPFAGLVDRDIGDSPALVVGSRGDQAGGP